MEALGAESEKLFSILASERGAAKGGGGARSVVCVCTGRGVDLVC